MRWVNPSHPQTLNIGVILLYFDAFFLLLRSQAPVALLLVAGAVASGVAIANDRRIGWYTGVAISAIVPLYLFYGLITGGFSLLFNVSFLIAAVFPVAQLAALIHPQSRSHVKIWFT